MPILLAVTAASQSLKGFGKSFGFCPKNKFLFLGLAASYTANINFIFLYFLSVCNIYFYFKLQLYGCG